MVVGGVTECIGPRGKWGPSDHDFKGPIANSVHRAQDS